MSAMLERLDGGDWVKILGAVVTIVGAFVL